ncbi:MAG: type IVB secretion system protein IcmH/DotU [bacterium]
MAFGRRAAKPGARSGAAHSAGERADRAARAANTPSLADAAGSLLSLIFVLRGTTDLDALPDLRGKVERVFAEFRSRARDLGAPAPDIEDGSYALAALVDETLLNANWAGRSAWQMNSFAKQYCNDEFVGLGFFDKLAQVRRTPGREHVVEVFYYCLASGFQGKLVEEPARITDLLDELSKEVSSSEKALAPHGAPAAEHGALEPIRQFPWPVVVVTFVFLPLLVWLISWHALNGQAGRIVRALSGGG